MCVLSGRQTQKRSLPACMHKWVVFIGIYVLSLVLFFKRVGREDVVSALDFTLSSVCRGKFRYLEQVAEKKMILFKGELNRALCEVNNR